MDKSVPSRLTNKEKFLFYNTLVCLVKALEKRYVTIDLRNETCVTGKLMEVDGYMNINLSNVAFFDTDGDYRYFQFLHIQARNIRNVHMPTGFSIKKALKNQVKEALQVQKTKKLTFKESRARKQQQETLKLIKKMKEEKSLNKEKIKSSK